MGGGLNVLSCSPSLSRVVRRDDVAESDAKNRTAIKRPMAAAAANVLKRRELPKDAEGISGVVSPIAALTIPRAKASKAGMSFTRTDDAAAGDDAAAAAASAAAAAASVAAACVLLPMQRGDEAPRTAGMDVTILH